MLEIPGRMQVTLVSHYGEKPDDLAKLIHDCQDLLSARLSEGFCSYQLEQIHGTIIGLEGHQKGRRILNKNSGKQVEPAAILCFLREQFPSIQIQIGGFCPSADYGFQSRGAHPYVRSFSIQDTIAVAMGWPVAGEAFPNSIDDLRWRFCRELGVRHKWHKTEDALDNDFFFVLGRIEPGVGTSRLRYAITEVRTFLRGLHGVLVRIQKESLWVVAYLDNRLPLGTSYALPVDDPLLTPDRLLAFYPMFDEV